MEALILSGGGVKGAYQVGAWKALRALGKEFKIVTGTSVGAINAAMYVQGDFDKAYELWYNLTVDDVIKGDSDLLEKVVSMDIKGKDIKQIIDFFSHVVGQKGLDISPLKKMLKTYIDEDKVRKSDIKLGIVTVSLTDFKPLELTIDEIPKGQLHDYLIASSNLPVFKMERLDNKLYIDGGFYDNVPIALAHRMGGEAYTVVDLNAIGIVKKFQTSKKRVIRSIEDIGGLLEITTDNIRKNIELGYYDTLKSYKGYLGNYYYIDNNREDQYVLKKFLNVNKIYFSDLLKMMDVKKMDQSRFILEKLIPHVATVLGYDNQASYEDIFVGILEHVALCEDIERFKVWQLSDLEDEVDKRYKSKVVSLKEKNIFEKLFSHFGMMTEHEKVTFFNAIYEKLVR